GVVRLDEPYAPHRPAVELHDVGHATDAMPDQSRENAPFALCPLTKVAVACGQKALGVATALTRRDRLTKHFDMLAGGHFQPSTAENAFDLRRGHDCTIAARGALAGGSRCAVTQSAASHNRAAVATAMSAPNEIKRASRARVRSTRCT